MHLFVLVEPLHWPSLHLFAMLGPLVAVCRIQWPSLHLFAGLENTVAFSISFAFRGRLYSCVTLRVRVHVRERVRVCRVHAWRVCAAVSHSAANL